MFEDAELGHTLSKQRFEKRLVKVRNALLDAQYALKDSRAFSVIVLMTGVEGGGRSETVNALASHRSRPELPEALRRLPRSRRARAARYVAGARAVADRRRSGPPLSRDVRRRGAAESAAGAARRPGRQGVAPHDPGRVIGRRRQADGP